MLRSFSFNEHLEIGCEDTEPHFCPCPCATLAIAATATKTASIRVQRMVFNLFALACFARSVELTQY